MPPPFAAETATPLFVESVSVLVTHAPFDNTPARMVVGPPARIKALPFGAEPPLPPAPVLLVVAIALEADNFGRCANTEDMREGARAFLAKRAPNFTGR